MVRTVGQPCEWAMDCYALQGLITAHQHDGPHACMHGICRAGSCASYIAKSSRLGSMWTAWNALKGTGACYVSWVSSMVGKLVGQT
mmetsp:Transcript_5516/g.9831  ORF Transcript_5516/g.9831 Transcript_5516/m.9831 type:complete len:86 (+) Transcript_5516:506-763(+)